MSERNPWESPDDDTAEQEIFTAELVGEEGPDGRNPVAGYVAGFVARCVERIRQGIAERAGKQSPAPNLAAGIVGSATETAIGALEGTLKGKSLDGALKEAQIVATYAEAREKNAVAAKAEAEAEKVRQDTAMERLERAVELIEKVGGVVHLATFPDGRIGIVVGDGLVGELPFSGIGLTASHSPEESGVAAHEAAPVADQPSQLHKPSD